MHGSERHAEQKHVGADRAIARSCRCRTVQLEHGAKAWCFSSHGGYRSLTQARLLGKPLNVAFAHPMESSTAASVLKITPKLCRQAFTAKLRVSENLANWL